MSKISILSRAAEFFKIIIHPNNYYYTSDHYNLAKNGVPTIFFFNGTHAGYHRTTDDVEKIDFDVMASRGKHIFHIIWEIAHRANRIVVDGEIK